MFWIKISQSEKSELSVTIPRHSWSTRRRSKTRGTYAQRKLVLSRRMRMRRMCRAPRALESIAIRFVAQDSDADSCCDTTFCGEGHVVRQNRRLRPGTMPQLTTAKLASPLSGQPNICSTPLPKKIGPVQVGAPVPWALQHQKWSPLNVLFFGEAASDSPTCPVVDCLHRTAGRVVDPVHFHENVTPKSGLVRTPPSTRGGWVPHLSFFLLSLASLRGIVAAR